MTTEDIDTYQSTTPSPQVLTRINRLLADDAAQQKRTWSHYQVIRKEDPAKYMSPKVQAAMHADALALGDKFTDGDF